MEDYEMKKYKFGDIILGIPSNIGPRILFLAHKKNPDENIFAVFKKSGVKTSEGFWKIFGGHRLWSAPEAEPRTYSRDDAPVEIEEGSGRVRITGPVEKENSIQKQIEITTHGCGAEVLHKIQNTGRWPIRTACWALSVMAPGGFAAAALKPAKGGNRLLPDRRISLWPYTDLADERLVLDKDYIFVGQKPEIAKPFKIGISAEPGICAYFLKGVVFLKKFNIKEGEHPDFGCNTEIYSCGEFLELETLGPLRIIEPGAVIEHREFWSLAPSTGLEPSADLVDGFFKET
jgi:hypothetical protein